MQNQTKETASTEQKPDFQVLLHAISSCSSVAVRQILNLDPSLVQCKGWYGQSPLHRACLTGDLDMVKILLEYGADPNALNDFGESTVHFASKRGMPAIVHTLVKHGGKIDVIDQKGRSPVHDAAQTGSVYMLQYFAERGCGFRTCDENKQTPLHHACSFGHLEAFKFLIRNGAGDVFTSIYHRRAIKRIWRVGGFIYSRIMGAESARSDPSQRDIDDNSPLHICAREGYAHGSWCLINYLGLGSLHQQNNDGYTPLDLCKQRDKESNKVLTPVLEELYKLPTNSKIKGPVSMWYFHLLMPFVAYAISMLLALFVFTETQGIWFVLTLGYIIKNSRHASHRLTHCSRWASPLFAGLFAAGMFHTMLVYYLHVIHYILDYQILILVSVCLNIAQLFLYWKLLKADPGEVRTSEINEKTHKPTTMTDLCEPGGMIDRFCVTCELVQGKDTKHCKLCEKCYYKMDHHCLFLLKCIGYNNHTRFVWFIIFTVCIMIIFLLEVIFIYIPSVYPLLGYKQVLGTMFWEDAWVLSMALLHVGSIVWAIMLLQYQMNVISKGQTTYFQASTTTLTSMERFLNAVNFLQGKRPYATDFMFDGNKGCCSNHSHFDNRNIHDV